MKVENPKISKIIPLSGNSEMSVEISDVLVEQIKKEYDIETIEDFHIQSFFRDILRDASLNSKLEQ
jgi:hypothetical protein